MKKKHKRMSYNNKNNPFTPVHAFGLLRYNCMEHKIIMYIYTNTCSTKKKWVPHVLLNLKKV